MNCFTSSLGIFGLLLYSQSFGTDLSIGSIALDPVLLSSSVLISTTYATGDPSPIIHPPQNIPPRFPPSPDTQRQVSSTSFVDSDIIHTVSATKVLSGTVPIVSASDSSPLEEDYPKSIEESEDLQPVQVIDLVKDNNEKTVLTKTTTSLPSKAFILPDASETPDERVEQASLAIGISYTLQGEGYMRAQDRKKAREIIPTTILELQNFIQATVESFEEIMQIDISTEMLVVHERRKARLFGFVPVSYAVRISIDPDTNSVDVSTKPWWLVFAADNYEEFKREITEAIEIPSEKPEGIQEVFVQYYGFIENVVGLIEV